MSRIIVGPFNRVEGDLEVKLDISNGAVKRAWVSASMYRGFEQILEGKPPADALVFAPRICGICSVSQSAAAAAALRDAMGIEQAPNGRLATNILTATENLADHLTHFYLFFMPDFAREVYHGETWGEYVRDRFTAMKGTVVEEFMPARKRLLEMVGILAGKWPHTLAIQPGGTTYAIGQSERVHLLSILADTRKFMERVIFGCSLEQMVELADGQALDNWWAEQGGEAGDFRTFLTLANELGLGSMGQTPGRCMSYGVYSEDDGKLFPQGLWQNGLSSLDPSQIAEDLSKSLFVGKTSHPSEGETIPDIDKADGYSWCKAPRLGGEVVEVGAFARQVIDGQSLVCSLAQESGSNVRNRIVARLIESARIILALEGWVDQFKLKESFCVTGKMPDDAEGVGMTEAARGSLGHWLKVRDGRISNYQIISPTTWNFSPRDSQGVAGPLEQALVGAPVRDGEKNPVSVQHIVRSFDPCMVCTVH